MADYAITIPVTTVEVKKEAPSLTYRLDLDAGRIVGCVDKLEAVNQAIRKAIITPRFKCLIYDNQYGSEIQDAIISKSVTSEYLEAVLPGFVEDCLKPDTRILSVYDFEYQYENERAYITFKADTIYGTTTIQEVY